MSSAAPSSLSFSGTEMKVPRCVQLRCTITDYSRTTEDRSGHDMRRENGGPNSLSSEEYSHDNDSGNGNE
jgi:hypothetical protein